jgi:Cdc6-like AAA superfamily ATPase
MSRGLIHKAAIGREFDAEPLPVSLPECHVPFRELVGVDVEASLDERLANYGRVGLVGPAGSGKSSIVRYVLRRSEEQRFAPVYVNVAVEEPGKVQTVRGFLEVLVAQLSRAARLADQLTPDEREALLRRGQPVEGLPGRESGRHLEVGASYWLLTGGLAHDVATTLPEREVYATTDAVRDAAREALAAIKEAGHVPVLVADDTDRLLRMPDPELSRKLFRGFFGEVLRMIVETLDAALVVAVHEGYRTEHEHRYEEMIEGRIEHHLDVPSIAAPDQIGRVISARAEFLEPGAAWSDLVDEAALRELLELYTTRHDRSLRWTLAGLKSAFALADDNGDELVTAQHVRAAAAR